MDCKLLVLTVSLVLAVSALPQDKIVGGQFAEPHQFPYQVALFYKGRFRCGGSVIESQWVLTAAHCVVNGDQQIPSSLLEVFVGNSDLNSGKETIEVSKVFAHESYGNFLNDIALMKVKKAFSFDDTVQKIALNKEELPEPTPVTISGYGQTGTTQPASDQLKFNTMYVVSEKVCRRETGLDQKGLICFNNEPNNGACNGDSGGPAVYDGKLVGVANFVMDACGTSSPDGYAKVAHYVDWIEQTIAKN
ncbi:serine protease SP24D-like [Wyeomyia smithii]|uniref:serine protease SP24D-like n=1 Tax=Wyeomyia smithii TaxID=174621 RepID=UPI002467FBCB|nr:serine protease SP24D-like [Wyeomyia smithii]